MTSLPKQNFKFMSQTEKQIIIRPAENTDLGAINAVLLDWLSDQETLHYTKTINEVVLDSTTEPVFDSHYYVAIFGKEVIGVVGFRTPNPKLLQFSTTQKPAELCMLYVTKQYRGGRGVGTALLQYVMEEAQKRKYEELLVRSSEKFSDTGWGFYDKMGFARVGTLAPPECKTSQIWTKKIPEKAK